LKGVLVLPESDQPAKGLPLTGLVVLDLTLARAGPTCARHLSDWGADVIIVQAPGATAETRASRDGYDYQNLHRGKRAISLDLKSPRGHEAFLRLARTADVVVENMRPAVKHRLGIAYEDLKTINPRLVYGSISGFGQDGPYGDRAGVDQIAQGMGGLMSITGAPGGGPMRAGIAVSDMTAGNLLALAIMMALFRRERTGEGAFVHTSLLESQLFMLDFQASRWLMAGEVAGQTGNDHPTIAPSSVYPTADGHINIAASWPAQWKTMCEAMGRSEWLENPDWRSSRGRVTHRDTLNAAIAKETATRPSAHWIALLEAAGIPCGPIYAIDQAFADPQVRHLGVAALVDHPRLGPTQMVASPLNISGADKTIRGAAPIGPDDTDDVLAGVGYTPAELADMRAGGVI
jgi:crotonobetainyl-CoA:carnitine CoA-transferase CaiB-like acyl-CoA transferase